MKKKIHQKTLRGGANWLVCSPSVATVLESIPGFASTSDGDVTKASYAFGIQKSGNLNNRYTVYKNPYMTENVILMGYRGSQFLETGAVFAPYVPLIMTPLVYDPDTFTPRKGLLTRYAKKMIEGGYLKEECAMCGFHERRVSDYKIPLILNFKDNNSNHYNLGNIRFLCYNCYYLNVGEIFNQQDLTQLETHEPKYGTSEAVDFQLDDYQKQRLAELGLYEPPKPENDGSEFISRL